MSTLYERVGGSPFFIQLVERFYQGVATDPILRPMYPEELQESQQHLAGFLIQYWGGPADYSAQRGHPRLRMRHMPFTIGAAQRDAWYRHMAAAVAQSGASPEDEGALLTYFHDTANFLVNHG